MNKRNNNGPNIDPCGTPDLIKDRRGHSMAIINGLLAGLKIRDKPLER